MSFCIKKIKSSTSKPPKFEASGNVKLENVREIAQSGVDRISVGALTHSYIAADISLIIR